MRKKILSLLLIAPVLDALSAGGNNPPPPRGILPPPGLAVDQYLTPLFIIGIFVYYRYRLKRA